MAPHLRRSRSVPLAAAALSVLLLAGGCAGGDAAEDGGGTAAWETGYVSAPGQGDAARIGGTLTVGSYSFPRSLDPLDNQISGAAGGTELAAIYDVLVRENEDGTYAPQLAESLTPSTDGRTWTVTLPAGATFSDGTPLTADAVKASIDRYAGSTASGVQTWNRIVAGTDVTGPQTVAFRLNYAWQNFPVLLCGAPGMIVAPAAYAGGGFRPIGAGPFTVSRFAQNEELDLSARDDYVKGRPPLDEVRFQPAAGAQMQLDSLHSGQFDMTYLFRDPEVIGQAESAGLPGFRDLQGAGTIAYINQSPGRDGADVRVRRAVALAVDPATMAQRVDGDDAVSGAALFPEGSEWHSDVAVVTPDAAQARQLVDQAKADGFDGTLTYLSTSDPSSRAGALAAQQMLGAVGITLQIDEVGSVADLIQRTYVDRDFDITRSGANLIDAAPYLRLYDAMGSESGDNPTGYADPATDALLESLLQATDDAQRRQIIDKIQLQVNDTVPFVVWGPAQIRETWTDDVHGVVRTFDDIMLLDQAWVSA